MLEDQFAVAYQPIVDAELGEVVAFEALVRWQHPTRGEVLPSVFISVAEEAGLIRNIGDWVLRTACTEAAKWPEHVKLAVNLSTVQVEAEGLVASVVSALGYSGLAPSRLEFEVTESVFLREGKSTGRTLDALRALAGTLALDDFGTGYSSLSYCSAISPNQDRCLCRSRPRASGTPSPSSRRSSRWRAARHGDRRRRRDREPNGRWRFGCRRSGLSAGPSAGQRTVRSRTDPRATSPSVPVPRRRNNRAAGTAGAEAFRVSNMRAPAFLGSVRGLGVMFGNTGLAPDGTG